MNNSIESSLRLLLAELETAMKERGLWSEQVPNHEALSSTQPFCLDTLAFEQWLQFIFIPRFNWLLSESMDLPASCCVWPMATEAFKDQSVQGILLLIKKIDGLFGDNA